MPTKAELQDDLDAATQRINRLRHAIVKLTDELADAKEATRAANKTSTGPAFVCFHAAGHLKGRGVVSAGMVMENPPAEALTRIPHTVIDEAKYQATAKRFGSGPTAPIGPKITTRPAGPKVQRRAHRARQGMTVTRTAVPEKEK